MLHTSDVMEPNENVEPKPSYKCPTILAFSSVLLTNGCEWHQAIWDVMKGVQLSITIPTSFLFVTASWKDLTVWKPIMTVLILI